MNMRNEYLGALKVLYPGQTDSELECAADELVRLDTTADTIRETMPRYGIHDTELALMLGPDLNWLAAPNTRLLGYPVRYGERNGVIVFTSPERFFER
jgi:hypothetical protein